MSRTLRLLTALRSALFATGPAGRPSAESLPGQAGSDATVELNPATVRTAGWGYAPDPDGDLDPGEIVWTWVPYEERDGRGKDRPVVIVATLPGATMLAVQLTSTDHSGDDDYLHLGAGPWDGARRPSWVALDRVFSVRQGGVRREGTMVDAARYALIEKALRARHGWR